MQLINTQTRTQIAMDGLAAAVGNTPLLPLRNMASDLPPSVKVYAKAEWFNPGGSVKARPALNIFTQAIVNGDLDGKRLLDSTSGNMGIAYATLGAAFNVPVTLTIPSNASPERIKILHALGAELFLTDPLEGSDGAMREAEQIAEANPDTYFYANQYANPANWRAHYQSTGPEIWAQTGGQVTHFVAGLGTSGTLMGTTRFLNEQNPEIISVAFQPDSPFHGLEGLKHMPSAHQPAIYDQNLPDEVREVDTEKAYKIMRRLAREEGLFVGISSGAAALAAFEVAQELDEGVVVTVFPDAGYKYLSNQVWEQK